MCVELFMLSISILLYIHDIRVCIDHYQELESEYDVVSFSDNRGRYECVHNLQQRKKAARSGKIISTPRKRGTCQKGGWGGGGREERWS